MNVFTRLLRRLDGRRPQREVDEELQFHLDLLSEELCQQDMSWEAAQASALDRFGNVQKIRDECVRIARRNHPVILALKWLFGFVFVAGVLVRIFAPEYHVLRVGNILMTVGVLSRLLLYLRVMNRSRYFSQPDDSSLIRLNDSSLSLSVYDDARRTPVERLISCK